MAKRNELDNATEAQRKTIFKITVGTITGDYDKVKKLTKEQVNRSIDLMRDYELENNYCFTHGIAGNCITKLSSFSRDFEGNSVYQYQQNKEKISAVLPLNFVNLVADYLAGNIVEESTTEKAENTRKGFDHSVKNKEVGSKSLSVSVSDIDVTDKIALMKLKLPALQELVLEAFEVPLQGTKKDLVGYLVTKYTQ